LKSFGGCKHHNSIVYRTAQIKYMGATGTRKMKIGNKDWKQSRILERNRSRHSWWQPSLHLSITTLMFIYKYHSKTVCLCHSTHVGKTLLGLSAAAACSQQFGCYTAYAVDLLQYYPITSKWPQLLPDDTKLITCKFGVTLVSTSRCSSQGQSNYGTVYFQTSAILHPTVSNRNFLRSTWSINCIKFLSHCIAQFYLPDFNRTPQNISQQVISTRGMTSLCIELATTLEDDDIVEVYC